MSRAECGFHTDERGSGQYHLVIAGPTLEVDAGFDPTFAAEPIGIPTPEIAKVPALIDTGAIVSCIDDTLAAQINLPMVDRKVISGVGGHHLANVYVAQIRSPQLDFVQYGRFYGVSLAQGGQSHQILIGRTFLRNFIMFYDGPTGTVTLVK